MIASQTLYDIDRIEIEWDAKTRCYHVMLFSAPAGRNLHCTIYGTVDKPQPKIAVMRAGAEL